MSIVTKWIIEEMEETKQEYLNTPAEFIDQENSQDSIASCSEEGQSIISLLKKAYSSGKASAGFLAAVIFL
jgi:hypothetical protein